MEHKQINERLKMQLGMMKCPVCNSPIIYGGYVDYFNYVQFDELDLGWQQGKDRSEGAHLQCPQNLSHRVVYPENWSELEEYLLSL